MSTLKTGFHDYFLKESFKHKISKGKESHRYWLAIPVEVYSICVAAEDTLPDLFSSMIFRLLKTGHTTVDKLKNITGLDQDLILLILTNDLYDKVKFSGDHLQLIEGSKSSNADHPVQEIREYQALRVVSTGKFIPRIFSKSDDVWCEPHSRNKKNYPIFSFQKSKGDEVFKLEPLILPINPSNAGTIKTDDIRELWEDYLIDYDASIDYFGEDKTIENAGIRYPFAREILSVEPVQNAYVLTKIISDVKDPEKWSCLDPFGLYQELGLSVLKEAVEYYCNDTFPIVRKNLSSIIENIISKKMDIIEDLYGVEDKIRERFGSNLPKRLQDYLVTMARKEEDLKKDPERRKEFIDDLFIAMQKTLESLFKNTWEDVNRKFLKRFKKPIPTINNRRDELKILLDNLGASEIDTVSDRLSSDLVWGSAYKPDKASLKSLLLEAIYSADRNSCHPLRKALICDPFIPIKIIKIADPRNMASHGQKEYSEEDFKDDEDDKIEKFINDTYQIVENITKNWEI
jgi:hypothetical protein